jgi:two-component system, sporulation sensor kinase E
MSEDSFLDRLIERLDRLDSSSVQGYVLRLVREKGFLDTVFETIQEGVIIIDRSLHMRFVNKAAIQMLGLPADPRERDTHTINRYLRELDWQRIMAHDADEWEFASRQEIEVYYPRHRYLQFYLLPFEGDEEAEQGLATVLLQDVTELHKRADSAMEAEKLNAITMLAAGVAHEIGNPLNSLNIHLQLLERMLKRETVDATEACEIVEVARGEVERLDGIIRQFLKALQPSQMELASLSLKDVVADTLELLKQEIKDRAIFVEGQWPQHIPNIMGDAGQLQQACYNIIRNAIQAMSEGGHLGISIATEEDAVVLAFADDGRGIPASDLGNVLDPYYTTREDGTGLGLMIVERIVREHGAGLGIESEPGEGTIVSIRFPTGRVRQRLLAPERSGQ